MWVYSSSFLIGLAHWFMNVTVYKLGLLHPLPCQFRSRPPAPAPIHWDVTFPRERLGFRTGRIAIRRMSLRNVCCIAVRVVHDCIDSRCHLWTQFRNGWCQYYIILCFFSTDGNRGETTCPRAPHCTSSGRLGYGIEQNIPSLNYLWIFKGTVSRKLEIEIAKSSSAVPSIS